jgi:hypothetical protein
LLKFLCNRVKELHFLVRQETTHKTESSYLILLKTLSLLEDLFINLIPIHWPMETEAHALEMHTGDYVRRDKKLKGRFGET